MPEFNLLYNSKKLRNSHAYGVPRNCEINLCTVYQYHCREHSRESTGNQNPVLIRTSLGHWEAYRGRRVGSYPPGWVARISSSFSVQLLTSFWLLCIKHRLLTEEPVLRRLMAMANGCTNAPNCMYTSFRIYGTMNIDETVDNGTRICFNCMKQASCKNVRCTDVSIAAGVLVHLLTATIFGMCKPIWHYVKDVWLETILNMSYVGELWRYTNEGNHNIN